MQEKAEQVGGIFVIVIFNFCTFAGQTREDEHEAETRDSVGRLFLFHLILIF